MKELEREFNRCWSRMLERGYTCRCKDKEGFAIRFKDLYIFGKAFKKDLFFTLKTSPKGDHSPKARGV